MDGWDASQATVAERRFVPGNQSAVERGPPRSRGRGKPTRHVARAGPREVRQGLDVRGSWRASGSAAGRWSDSRPALQRAFDWDRTAAGEASVEL